jgi:hypothetical protein
VDLLPDRKLAATISGKRRIGAMYTTLIRQYAIEISANLRKIKKKGGA